MTQYHIILKVLRNDFRDLSNQNEHDNLSQVRA